MKNPPGNCLWLSFFSKIKSNFNKTDVMESLQFKTTLSSLTEIKIPDDLKEKIELNQQVRVLLIPDGERIYEEWNDDEWNKLSLMLNDDGE